MRKVCGVGINDMKGRWCCSPKGGCKSVPYNHYEHTVYSIWYGMMYRSYKLKVSFVCDRWKYLSNFINDIRYIPGYSLFLRGLGSKGVFLDKDLKYYGNRTYDPSTVMFITCVQSVKERNSRRGNPFIINPQLRAKPVKATNIKDPSDVLYYSSASETSSDGFDISGVCRCCRGEYKSHKGYFWEYI